MNRRSFVATTALGASTIALHGVPRQNFHIAANVYPWMTFARRSGKNWGENLDQDIKNVAKTGVQGFEPIGDSPKQIRKLGIQLNKHNLEMRSLYVNSILHESKDVDASIKNVLAIAAEAKKLGTKIIVTNPTPIRWGGPENKNDQQLITQANALDLLGHEINQLGLTLAYHNHDAELREGAREFHHMLTATNPDNLKLCLDSHWIFRGCGDSQVALFDAIDHYHSRIVELHLRQSKGGYWTEAFTMNGDIDYLRLFEQLKSWKIKPHFVLEQAIEQKSPDTMTAIEAHQASEKNLRRALEQM
jgi:inosose dehydratase